jgi:predicted MPP superfamily phosphohydrolase
MQAEAIQLHSPAPAKRSAFIFQFGAFNPLLVRHEVVDLGLSRPIRLLYASDLHLGRWWSNPIAAQLVAAARQAAPDRIILGGDLVDSPRGLPLLADCTERLSSLAPVHALPGNHDGRVGLNAVRAAVVSAGATWLPDESSLPSLPGGFPLPATPDSKAILLAHDPAVFPQAIRAGYRLVLAGHLHGGQCVLATRNHRLYPGAFFARWTGLRFTDSNATLVVSRGAADTLPFRWNCPREVILCEVT